MHKRLCAVVLAALAVLTGSATAAPKQKVALMPLQASEGVSAGLASVVTDALAVELQRRPGMSAVTPNDIETALKFERQKAQVSAEVAARTGNDVCIDDSCLAEIGGALGVDRMVSGSITRVGEMYFMTFQSFDPRKATVVARGQWRAKVGSEPELIDAAASVVDTLFGAPPATLRPAGPAATATPTPAAPRPNPPAVVREDSVPVGEQRLRESGPALATMKPVAPPSQRAGSDAWSRERSPQAPDSAGSDATLEPLAPPSASVSTLSRPSIPRRRTNTKPAGVPTLELMLNDPGRTLMARVEVDTAQGTQVCAAVESGAPCVLEVPEGKAKLRVSGDVTLEKEVELTAGRNVAYFASGVRPGMKGMLIAGSVMTALGGGALLTSAFRGCFGKSEIVKDMSCFMPMVIGGSFGGIGLVLALAPLPHLLSAKDTASFASNVDAPEWSARDTASGAPELAIGYSPSDRRKSISARWSF